jgi:hypothetical protein
MAGHLTTDSSTNPIRNDKQVDTDTLIADVADGVLILLVFAPGICPIRHVDRKSHTYFNCSYPAIIRLDQNGLDALCRDKYQIGVSETNLVIVLQRMSLSDLATVDKGSITGEVILY